MPFNPTKTNESLSLSLKKIEFMKVKELIERLKNVDPDAEIWVSTHNESNAATYGVMDQAFEFNFENLWPDLQNTLSDIDDL